jgi:hypothetical protein
MQKIFEEMRFVKIITKQLEGWLAILFKK